MIKINVIDRIVEVFSPRAAHERYAYRRELERNFSSVKGTRLPQNIRLTTGTAEQVNSSSRDTVRALARTLENNADISESIFSAFSRNVIGSGLTLQCKNSDELVNETIEKVFSEWSTVGGCEITGKLSFTDVQEMILRRILYDGGILVKRITTTDYVPFKLQLIEVDALNTSATPNDSANRIEGGVEVDSFGRDVGYHICKTDKYGFNTSNTEYVKASDMVFLRKVKRPSQIREMSQMACTAGRVSDTDEYLDAVSQKERIAASYAVFITSQAPSAGIGRGNVTSKSTDAGTPLQRVTPGTISYLNKGETAQALSPNGQAADTETFIRTQIRLLSSGQGLSYETVSRDLSNVNYSSARQNLLEDRETFNGWQRFIIEHFCEFVYREFVLSLILRGILSGKVDDYKAHKWISSGYNWIDPLKEAKANEAALNSNQTTLEILCAEKGLDYKEVLAQRAREKELMCDLGLTVEMKPSKENRGKELENTGVSTDGTIAQVSLNGAQIQALLMIVQSVTDGALGYEAGLTLITSSFPYDIETAKKILGDPDKLKTSEEVSNSANKQPEEDGTNE